MRLAGLLGCEHTSIVRLQAPLTCYHDFRNLGTQTRIAILGAFAAASIIFLAVRRFATGIPFLPPPDYRSFTVFNKSEFIALYGADALPSKAPIERIEGEREKWAWLQTACLGALVVVDAVLLGLRLAKGESYLYYAEEGLSFSDPDQITVIDVC